MKVYCLSRFKNEFEKLVRKNSYEDLELLIINHFFEKDSTDLESGSRLNGHAKIPYIKKRLGGAGGYRIYYLYDIQKEIVYLMFVHPKTGSLGTDEIGDENRTLLLKEIISTIKTGNLITLEIDLKDKKKLSFV